MEGKKGCKIRKRGCSSSSSSSLARRNRFKRAILAGKRVARDGGRSGTPMKSPAAGISPGFLYSPGNFPTETQNSFVSARKLAAMLWEIGISISPPRNSNRDCLENKKSARNRASSRQPPHSFPPNLSESVFRFGSDRKIQNIPEVPQNLQLVDHKTAGMNSTETRHRKNSIGGGLKDVKDSLTTSKELVNVLARFVELDDHHHRTARKRLISAVRCELDRARSTLKRLMREKSDGELRRLMENFAEEKRRLRRRAEEEVEAEKKLRKQTERMNKKLGHELAEAKAAVRRMTEELERERRKKEILEEVCDELVIGVGEDKAEAERLREEAEREKGEVEREREMMHIADILREERVQMKLSEARFEFEEKSAAVERLKKELRRVLNAEGEEGGDNGSSSGLRRISRILENIEGDGSDADSDLKSIELNVDSGSKSCKWSYVESGKIFSGTDCRRDTDSIGSDDDRDRKSFGDSVEKRSVIIGDDENDRDKCIKSLRDYIISNARFITQSEQRKRVEEFSPE